MGDVPLLLRLPESCSDSDTKWGDLPCPIRRVATKATSQLGVLESLRILGKHQLASGLEHEFYFPQPDWG